MVIIKSVLAGLCLVTAFALGQAVEVPKSFDSGGLLYRLSPEAWAQTGIFPELAGFNYLELWQTEDGVVLEVYRPDRTRVRRRISQEELVLIRQQVDAQLRQQPKRLNQEGRGSFLLQQIPLALGWYGPATTALLIPKADLQYQAALSLVVSSAAFFAPLLAMRNMKMTQAQAHLCVANGYRGVLAGYLVGHMFHISEYRAYSAIMMVASIGGQVAGYRLADKLSLGQATLVTAYTDLGLLDGALLGAAIRDWTDDPKRYNISLSTWSLAGLAGGSVAGNIIAPKWNCTEGQVTALRTGTIVGAAVPLALYATLAEDFSPPAFLLGIGGSIGGTLWAQSSIRLHQLSNGNGLIVTGMTLGGALFGAGLGVLTNQSKVVSVAGSIGAIGGLAGGLALAKSLQAGQSSQSRLEPRLEFNCAGIICGVAHYAVNQRFGVPDLVTVRF